MSRLIAIQKEVTVQPEPQRSIATQMSSAVCETEYHVSAMSQLDLVADVIHNNADRRSADPVRTYSAIVDAFTATVINAQAGLNWLSSQPPNLEEVRRVLNTITDEGQRAGELVVRLPAPVRRSITNGWRSRSMS